MPTASVDSSEPFSVLVVGHIYGAYVKTYLGKGDPLIHSEAPVAAMAKAFARHRPQVVFFLGDHTRYGEQKEWDMLQSYFDGLDSQKIWVAGNHDLRNKETFEAQGGVYNKAFVIGRNKFICLDAKVVYEPEDLAFISQELVDADRFDHVFVMMHFRLHIYTDPEPGADPYQTGTGKSNWNRDVVPLLLGKVTAVVTGDHYAKNAGKNVVDYDGQDLTYIHTSVQYPGHDGPMVYLEFVFRDGSLEILPHAVPLPLSDSWYDDFSLVKPASSP